MLEIHWYIGTNFPRNYINLLCELIFVERSTHPSADSDSQRKILLVQVNIFSTYLHRYIKNSLHSELKSFTSVKLRRELAIIR